MRRSISLQKAGTIPATCVKLTPLSDVRALEIGGITFDAVSPAVIDSMADAHLYRPRGRKVNETFTSVETCSVVHAMTAKRTLCLEVGIQGRFAERPDFAPGHLFDYLCEKVHMRFLVKRNRSRTGAIPQG